MLKATEKIWCIITLVYGTFYETVKYTAVSLFCACYLYITGIGFDDIHNESHFNNKYNLLEWLIGVTNS